MGIKDRILETASEFLDGGAVTRSLIRRKLRRRVCEALEEIPPARIRKLVESQADSSLVVDVLLPILAPEKTLADVKSEANGKYRWVGEILSDQDLVDLLPKWVLDILEEYGEEGKEWLSREIQNARATFFPKENDDGRDRVAGGHNDQGGTGGDSDQTQAETYTYRRRSSPANPAS